MKRNIFTSRNWPYWIPDPFNLALLAIMFLALIGFLFVIGVW